jgi:hypothetical protein
LLLSIDVLLFVKKKHPFSAYFTVRQNRKLWHWTHKNSLRGSKLVRLDTNFEIVKCMFFPLVATFFTKIKDENSMCHPRNNLFFFRDRMADMDPVIVAQEETHVCPNSIFKGLVA